MPSVGTASIDIVADKQQLGRSITGAVDGNKGLFHSTGANLAKTLFTGFAAYKAVGLFKEAIDEAREAAKVQKQTNAVLASTKGAANIGAQGVGDLATQLSNMAGIDDELIQSGENVLLTFTNVKNATGKGNDVFNQATKAALNMSSALGTDLQGSVIQVGKALNDPIKGITALSRVGVSFTAQQKEQIKTMVAAGDTLGAQKLILKELGTEFGGAAEAAADPMQKLGVVWKNLEETLGTAILPLVNKAATWLGNNLPGALKKTSDGFGRIINLGKGLVAAFKDPVDQFDKNATTIDKVGATLRKVWDNVLKPVGEWFRTHWKVALGVAIFAFTGLIGVAVVGLALLYVKFKGFRDAVAAVVGFFKTSVIPAFKAVASFLSGEFSKAADWFRKIWPQISEAVRHTMNVIRDIVTIVVNVVSALWRAWGDDLLRIVKTIWNFIQETVSNALQVVRGIIQFVLAIINGDWGRAWDALKSIVGAVWDQIGNVISTAFGVLRGLFGGFVSTISEMWSGLWNGLKGVFDGIWVGIQNSFRTGMNVIIQVLNGMIRAYNFLPGHKDIDTLSHIDPISHSGSIDTQKLKDTGQFLVGGQYADGGWVTAPKGQPQLAIVHGGEYVVSNDMLANASTANAAGGPMIGQLVVHANTPAEGQAAGRALIATLENYRRNGGAFPAWWAQRSATA